MTRAVRAINICLHLLRLYKAKRASWQEAFKIRIQTVRACWQPNPTATDT
jgi:hypothetical protein